MLWPCRWHFYYSRFCPGSGFGSSGRETCWIATPVDFVSPVPSAISLSASMPTKWRCAIHHRQATNFMVLHHLASFIDILIFEAKYRIGRHDFLAMHLVRMKIVRSPADGDVSIGNHADQLVAIDKPAACRCHGHAFVQRYLRSAYRYRQFQRPRVMISFTCIEISFVDLRLHFRFF